jgi:hypothetical protein
MRKILSMPVVSALNTRVSASNPLPATSGVVGIGVVGLMVVGQSVDPTSKDARYINCFKQTVSDEAHGKRTYRCVKRSGLASLNTPQSGSIGTSILVWSGQGSGTKVITAFGGTNSSIYDGTTRLTTNNADTTVITGKAASITETTVSNTATLYITSTDSTAWYYQNAGTVTKISDAQFPGNNSLTLAGGGAHMDGYIFQMDTLGGIWNSDLNSITSWTAAGTINANIYPDKGVGCVRWKQYIIGFGAESMEFFYNAGNATGSPLTRIAHMAKRIGAVSADAITSISDNIFFCGSTPQGGLSIYQYDGEVSRISPPELDAVLLLAGASNIKLTAYRDFGLSFIIVKAGTTQYEYCIEEKFWSVRLSHLGFCRFAALSTGTSQVSYAVSELVTSGKVYTINPASRVFQDDSQTYTARMQLLAIDPGNGRFVAYEQAEVVADVESSTSALTLVWSDDDYVTYSTGRSLDLSTNVPRTHRLGGTDKPRAFALVHSSNTPMRVSELRLRVDIGS